MCGGSRNEDCSFYRHRRGSYTQELPILYCKKEGRIIYWRKEEPWWNNNEMQPVYRNGVCTFGFRPAHTYSYWTQSETSPSMCLTGKPQGLVSCSGVESTMIMLVEKFPRNTSMTENTLFLFSFYIPWYTITWFIVCLLDDSAMQMCLNAFIQTLSKIWLIWKKKWKK